MNSKTLRSSTRDAVSFDLGYWQLFRELPEAYTVLEAAEPYVVVEVNKATEMFTGRSRDQLVGRPLAEAFPDKGPLQSGAGLSEARRRMREVIEARQPREFDILRYDVVDERGVPRPRYWQTGYVPIMDSDTVRFVVVSVQDVTYQVRAAREVSEVEERLEAALDVGKVGSWMWDLQNNLVTGDKNLARLFHLPKEDVATGLHVEDFLSTVHHHDLPRVRDRIERSLLTHIQFDEEFRLQLDDDSHWVLVRGQVEAQDDRTIFAGVIVDITERHDLQAQVEMARRQDRLNRRAALMLQTRNQELEAISRSKDEFVALASHQLRTPATAVKQYVGMVLQGYTGAISDIQAEMLQKAFESNERQIQIINQILSAARADTGRLVMSPILLDLRVLAQSAWNDMRPLFEQRGLRYHFVPPKRPMLTQADQTYLRMAIENLLHNACVYTPAGGEVTMRLAKTAHSYVLRVTDTGVGIKKADLGKLFAKFSRIYNDLSVQAGGSGIGLYLAAEIVRLHGGTIDVESKIRQGSTFAISLPLLQNKG